MRFLSKCLFSKNEESMPDRRSAELENDPDILAEDAQFLNLSSAGSGKSAARATGELPRRDAIGVPLRVVDRTFVTTDDTAGLLESIGGSQALRRMTDLFYTRAFADPHLQQFFHSFDDPHASRLASWIAEKMGGEGPVWSQERVERARNPVPVMLQDGHGGRPTPHVVMDRTTAHVAAWYAPRRAPAVAGRRFEVHDCRVWMRLMFWSARDCGLFAPERPAFEEWFTRFIAHFVRVYERDAPRFARESARWSASRANVDAYLAGGGMPDVVGADGDGVSWDTCAQQLPPEELLDNVWPYEAGR